MMFDFFSVLKYVLQKNHFFSLLFPLFYYLKKKKIVEYVRTL